MSGNESQAYTVQYGPPSRYYVRREADKRAVFSDVSKSTVIAKAEELNGWPITGSELGYAKTRDEQDAKREAAR